MAADTDRRALADIMRRHIRLERDSEACLDRLAGFEAAAEEIAALRAGDAGEVRAPPLNTAWDTRGNLIGPSDRAVGSITPIIGGWRAWAYRLPGDGRAALSAKHPTESAARAWVEARVAEHDQEGRHG